MRVRIRPLRRGDRATVAAVFDGLSAESRYTRYHGPVRELSAMLLDRLADVDGHDHTAVVAVVGRGRAARPVGLARLVRTGATSAELAVEVVDDAQGMGVGRRLVTWASRTAPSLGFDEVVAEVLVDNGPMRRLVTDCFPGALASSDGRVVTYRCLVGARSWSFEAADLVGAVAPA